MHYEFLPFGLNWTPRVDAQSEGPSKVILIPGFMAGDASLYPLALALRSIGYRTFFSGILVNMDCPRDTIERLSQTLHGTFLSDQRKVVLIGHSLGGIYARELARRFPDRVERVIALGSSLREPLSNTNPLVRMWFLASRRPHPEGGSCLDHLESLCGAHQSEPVPWIEHTLIYSRNDVVVDWESCIEKGPNIEAIEVKAGHNTMPYSPEVFAIIADRLKREVPKLRVVRRAARARG